MQCRLLASCRAWRSATSSFPAVAMLRAVGLSLASEAEMTEAVDALEALAFELAPGHPTRANEAKQLALAIGGLARPRCARVPPGAPP